MSIRLNAVVVATVLSGATAEPRLEQGAAR
jgi:hypothetical protein